jgi:hypothetical protein
MSVQVQPATANRWDDLVTVFGRRGENPSWCWCPRFLSSRETPASGPKSNNRRALRQEIALPERLPGSSPTPAANPSVGPGSVRVQPFPGWGPIRLWQGCLPRIPGPSG